MAKEYFKLIRSLRTEKKLSQEEISNKIGVSRSSYITFEQGKTELNFPQMAKLADIFGISLEEIKGGVRPNYAKYKQMILAFLRPGEGMGGQITKTKLAKLLYLADFAWFYKHLEGMSNMPYRKIQYGPVPDNYFRAIDELFDDGSIEIDNTSREGVFLISQTRSSERKELSDLSVAEKKLIKQISLKWKDKRTSEIVKFTHDQLPYMICEDNEVIPYGLITQENPDHVY